MAQTLLRIALSRPIPAPLLDRLRKFGEIAVPEMPLEGNALSDWMADADFALVTALDNIGTDVLARSTRLKAIASVGAGMNHIDVSDCTARGIRVSNTPGAMNDATADLAFGLMIAAARRLVEADGFVRAGKWIPDALPMFGLDIHHRRLGIIGMGGIGRVLVKRAHGFDMDVVYHNRSRLPSADEEAHGVRYLPLVELLKCADFVILQVPYGPETHHLIGAEQLALMKKTAILVNTARGGVVDDAALAAALAAGTIAAAGLDVVENEPQVNPALLELPNVVLAPHIGSATLATRQVMFLQAVDNLVDALEGRIPRDCVNC